MATADSAAAGDHRRDHGSRSPRQRRRAGATDPRTVPPVDSRQEQPRGSSHRIVLLPSGLGNVTPAAYPPEHHVIRDLRIVTERLALDHSLSICPLSDHVRNAAGAAGLGLIVAL